MIVASAGCSLAVHSLVCSGFSGSSAFFIRMRDMPIFLIRNLPLAARLGLSALMLVLLLGMCASAFHLWSVDHNRDETARMSMDDVRAAYHGLDRPPALQTSLERGHPEALKKEQRDVLLKWVRSGRITEDYDSIDLGVASPSEIIASSCVSCHSANGKDPAAAAIRLASMENLKKVAFGKKVNPTPVNIVAMSTHAHALSLGMLGVVLAGLVWMTRLNRGMAGGMIGLMGVALAADLGSWWWARVWSDAVWLIVIGGGVCNGLLALMAVVVVVDLWWPRGGKRQGDRVTG